MDGGDRLTQAVAGLLLCGVAFVTVRALLAERRGDDPRQAARGAFRILAPGLFVGAVGLFAFLVFAALSTLFLIFAVLHLLTRESAYEAGALVILIGGALFLVVTVVGALWWGVRRLRSSRTGG